MKLDHRTVESRDALELYITATPDPARDPKAEARDIYQAVTDLARTHHARICRERVFVPDGQIDAWVAARRESFEIEKLPIATDWLSAGPLSAGAVGGIQIHALRGPTEYRPLTHGDDVLGVTFRQNGHRWALTSGLVVPECGGDGPEQSVAAFEEGERLLSQAGMDMHAVARTWLFMDDILSWYGRFNQVRNRLFIDRGLLKRGNAADDSDVPASTGIGVAPLSSNKSTRVALEMFAVKGPDKCVHRFQAAGKQRAAFEYGSAFARASDAPTPAGRTVFISGTAAIDEAGNTCHVGDIPKQIDMTLVNMLAVLRDTHCQSKNVVQAMAYCKTPEVAREFKKNFEGRLNWPWVTVIGDVCRDDLLFEGEVTVCEPSPN